MRRAAPPEGPSPTLPASRPRLRPRTPGARGERAMSTPPRVGVPRAIQRHAPAPRPAVASNGLQHDGGSRPLARARQGSGASSVARPGRTMQRDRHVAVAGLSATPGNVAPAQRRPASVDPSRGADASDAAARRGVTDAAHGPDTGHRSAVASARAGKGTKHAGIPPWLSKRTPPTAGPSRGSRRKSQAPAGGVEPATTSLTLSSGSTERSCSSGSTDSPRSVGSAPASWKGPATTPEGRLAPPPAATVQRLPFSGPPAPAGPRKGTGTGPGRKATALDGMSLLALCRLKESGMLNDDEFTMLKERLMVEILSRSPHTPAARVTEANV